MSAITSPLFKDNRRAALADRQLQRALSEVPLGLAARRGAARAGLPEFEALREIGRDIKNHTLAHLHLYLEEFERKATVIVRHPIYATPIPRGVARRPG